MKKLGFLLVMLLALALAVGCASAQTLMYEDAYVMRFPDDWTRTDGAGAQDGGYVDIAAFRSPDGMLEVSMDSFHWDGMETIDMFAPSQNQLDSTASLLIRAYQMSGATVTHQETIYANTREQAFIVLKFDEDFDGPDNYYAVTHHEGDFYGVSFHAYESADSDTKRRMTDEEYQQFVDIIKTFFMPLNGESYATWDEQGNQIDYHYDEEGNVQAMFVSAQDGSYTSTGYDSEGNVTYSYAYNAEGYRIIEDGFLEFTWNDAGMQVNNYYDKDMNKTHYEIYEMEGMTCKAIYTYDAQDRLTGIRTFNEDGSYTEVEYDENGNEIPQGE